METVNTKQQIEALENATTQDEETQALRECRGILDIVVDLPGDAGHMWAVYTNNCDDAAIKLYNNLAEKLGLHWERGAWRYYIVGKSQLRQAVNEFKKHRFVVALCVDAMRNMI